MSYIKATWWRPAAGALVALAIAALWLMGATASNAAGAGSITLDPQDGQVGAGGTLDVKVNVEPPAAGLSIWIVEISYDPTKVQVDTSGGNPVCGSLDIPGGVAGAAGCATKDTNTDGKMDTAVAFGGWVQNNGGTAVGFTDTKQVADFTFRAVGNVGDMSSLHISVTSFLDPTGASTTPTANDGSITIIQQQGETHVWGDINCDGSISLGDAIGIARFLVSLTVNQTQPCPAMGAAITVDSNPQHWADINCDGTVTLGDSIGIARNLVSLTVNQTQPCPAMGSSVQVVS